MREEIDRFLASLSDERNASPHTLRAYAKDLSQLQDFARARLGHEPVVTEIDLWLLRAFFADLHARQASPTTAGRKLATFRSFFRHLCREGTLTKTRRAAWWPHVRTSESPPICRSRRRGIS